MWISEIRRQQLQTCYRAADVEYGPAIPIHEISEGETYIIANIKKSKIMALDTIATLKTAYAKQLKADDPSWSKLRDDAIFAVVKKVHVPDNIIEIKIAHPTAHRMMTLHEDAIPLAVSTTQRPNKVTVHKIPNAMVKLAAAVEGTEARAPQKKRPHDQMDEIHFLQWRRTKSGGASEYGHKFVKNMDDILQYMIDQPVEEDETLTVRYMKKEYVRTGSMPPRELTSTVSWGKRRRKFEDEDAVAAYALQEMSRTDR